MNVLLLLACVRPPVGAPIPASTEPGLDSMRWNENSSFAPIGDDAAWALLDRCLKAWQESEQGWTPEGVTAGTIADGALEFDPGSPVPVRACIRDVVDRVGPGAHGTVEVFYQAGSRWAAREAAETDGLTACLGGDAARCAAFAGAIPMERVTPALVAWSDTARLLERWPAGEPWATWAGRGALCDTLVGRELAGFHRARCVADPLSAATLLGWSDPPDAEIVRYGAGLADPVERGRFADGLWALAGATLPSSTLFGGPWEAPAARMFAEDPARREWALDAVRSRGCVERESYEHRADAREMTDDLLDALVAVRGCEGLAEDRLHACGYGSPPVSLRSEVVERPWALGAVLARCERVPVALVEAVRAELVKDEVAPVLRMLGRLGEHPRADLLGALRPELTVLAGWPVRDVSEAARSLLAGAATGP